VRHAIGVAVLHQRGKLTPFTKRLAVESNIPTD